MLLTLRPLIDVGSVNIFRYAENFQFVEGDGPTLYFQLIDASVDLANQGFRPAGRRYMPAASATLQCVVNSIDISKVVTRFATQPYSQDPSIWMLQLQSTDPVRGTADIILTLTEGTKVTRAVVPRIILSSPQIG